MHVIMIFIFFNFSQHYMLLNLVHVCEILQIHMLMLCPSNQYVDDVLGGRHSPNTWTVLNTLCMLVVYFIIPHNYWILQLEELYLRSYILGLISTYGGY
jgi:hypothetical protein